MLLVVRVVVCLFGGCVVWIVGLFVCMGCVFFVGVFVCLKIDG